MKFVNYLHKGLKKIGISFNSNDVYSFNQFNKIVHIYNPVDMIDLIKNFDEKIKKNIPKIKENLDKISSDGSLEDLKLLAPIEYPIRNIICLGKNYLDHCMEMEGKTSDHIDIPQKPIYFSKMAYPTIGDKEDVIVNWDATKMIDYEVELAIIIGKKGKNILESDAQNYIFGYTIVNDISARDIQMDHIQWFVGKSHDGFSPMGPVILYKNEVSFPPALKITSYVNGECRQDSYTNRLIFDIPYIISNLSKGITLFPGDIIITGTPSGVGMGFEPPKYLSSGDLVRCEIDKIGALTNTIK